MSNLKQKVAVVTGAASGIGRAIAEQLAQQACHVIVADIELEKAEAVAAILRRQQVQSIAIECDVSQMHSVENLAEEAWREFGEVNLLFNNAGVMSSAPLLDADARDMHWLFSVNVFGLWHGCQVFGRRFLDQDSGGHIINMGSEHSLGVPHLNAGLYTATKHAVLALSDVLRQEVAGKIDVSVVCPGLVDTQFWDARRNRPESYGGPKASSDRAKLIQAQGMESTRLAKQIVNGVVNKDFYIMTHTHLHDLVDQRYGQQKQALDKQVPYDVDLAQRYEISQVVKSVLDKK